MAPFLLRQPAQNWLRETPRGDLAAVLRAKINAKPQLLAHAAPGPAAPRRLPANWRTLFLCGGTANRGPECGSYASLGTQIIFLTR
ncbi:hypothetical protein MPC4_50149 [Methylocella tundrae]|uniref:Uncharacterized protein n=1 Tax=Methylocella tundrae TaxID=227605 RepID=A0A8B6MAT7_METTU|nr:hypothetical protein MPC4_50149 [Methylocella tundrae]